MCASASPTLLAACGLHNASRCARSTLDIVHNTLGISLRSCCAEPNTIDEYNETKAADEVAKGIGELHLSQQASEL
jgi:hypothetical protein